MAKGKKKKVSDNTIGQNRKARHDFSISDDFEAGIALEGWEVKSLRDHRLQLAESYVLVQNGEAFLMHATITPLQTVSTHITPNPTRMRKLLLHRRELDKLTGSVDRGGYTIVPLSMYWKSNHVKVKIALAKGKQKHDKRASEKDKDWSRDKARILREK